MTSPLCMNSGSWMVAPVSSFARDRKSTRLNSSHSQISYAVFCLKKKKTHTVLRCFAHALQFPDARYHFSPHVGGNRAGALCTALHSFAAHSPRLAIPHAPLFFHQ